LREPADQVNAFRTQAIESYRQLLKQFPKSELGAVALSSMGTLYYLLGKAADANTVYEQLKRDFPDAPQARNIIFARGQSLLDLGRVDDAVKVFDEMFANPKPYSASQFMLVGDEMHKIGQSKTAVRAYRQAAMLAASDTNSARALGLGNVHDGPEPGEHGAEQLPRVRPGGGAVVPEILELVLHGGRQLPAEPGPMPRSQPRNPRRSAVSVSPKPAARSTRPAVSQRNPI
jgi:tetratricopeptide (TPR) repeat protein